MIPQIIHYIWFGGGKMSPLSIKCINSWEEILPNYEIMLWDENNFNPEDSFPYVRDAYEAKKWAFVSDYVRLMALYEYGGIYLDTDMELLKPFDSILEYNGFLCAESNHTISSAIIASAPKTQWVKDLMDEYANLQFVKEDGSYDVIPNTKRYQRYFERRYAYHWSDDIQKFDDDMLILPRDYFSPINCFTGLTKMTDRTCGIHHYESSWKSDYDMIKNKLMQIGTRIIGEDNRARLVKLRHMGGDKF